MLLQEVSSAELDDSFHADDAGLVDFDCEIQTGHGEKLELFLVDWPQGKVSIQIAERNADNFSREIIVVYNLVGPLANLFSPYFIDARA